MNGGSGQWKRLRSRMGHALDDDDDGLKSVSAPECDAGNVVAESFVSDLATVA